MATPEVFWDMYARYYGHGSVEDFQRFAGLEPTGALDEATVEKLYHPRCGVSDTLRATLDARWRKNRLTYCIQSRVQLDADRVDQTIGQAFASWAAVADLGFERVESIQEANLVISTGRGPRAGFDGPSGTLAWAQLPNGQDQQLLMRFDLDEDWDRTILLLNVAAHEFGHLLGLDHDAQNSGALMAPFYNRSIATPQANDIRRIQAYYGPPRAVPPTPPPAPQPPTPRPQPPTIPGGGFVDAIFEKLANEIIDQVQEIVKGAAAKTTWPFDDWLVAGVNRYLDAHQAEFVTALRDKLKGLLGGVLTGQMTVEELHAQLKA